MSQLIQYILTKVAILWLCVNDNITYVCLKCVSSVSQVMYSLIPPLTSNQISPQVTHSVYLHHSTNQKTPKTTTKSENVLFLKLNQSPSALWHIAFWFDFWLSLVDCCCRRAPEFVCVCVFWMNCAARQTAVVNLRNKSKYITNARANIKFC